MALYQPIKFDLIPFYTFRDMLQINFLLQKIKREVTLKILLTGLWFLCIAADSLLSMYQVSFTSLVYFQRYTPDKFFIAKNKKGSNSVNIVDRVMILAICVFSDGPLSMCQVSFNSLTYYERYAPDKLFIEKNYKGK